MTASMLLAPTWLGWLALAPFASGISVTALGPAAAPPTTETPGTTSGLTAPGPGPAPTEGGPVWREDVPEGEDPVDLALAPSQQGLTADQVAARAVATGPTIGVKQSEIEAAAARIDQTAARYLPQIQLSAGYERLSWVRLVFGSGALVGAEAPGFLGTDPATGQVIVRDAEGNPVQVEDPVTGAQRNAGLVATQFRLPVLLNNYTLQASLSVPISDYVFRLAQGIKGARRAHRAAELNREAEKRRVATDGRIAYYNWLRAKAQLAVAIDTRNTAAARLEDARISHRVGVLSNAEFLQIEANAANAEAQVINAEAFEELSRRNMSIIMGEPVQNYAIGENIVGEAYVIEDWPALERLVDEATSERPELAALDENREGLRYGIKTERAGYYPRLDGRANAVYANPNQRIFPLQDRFRATWAVGLTLSWNLTQIADAHSRIKEFEAQERGLTAQREQLRRAVEQEVTKAWIDRKQALAALAVSQKNREASEAAYAATAASFRVGRSTATDVIAAQGQVWNARLQAINARIDIEVAEARLAYATGRSVVPTTAVDK